MLYLIARFVLRPAFLILRPTITGRENVPATGPFIIASNHLSFIDSMAIPLMAPRKVGYLAKAEYFTGTGIKGWFSRTLFTALGALPVHRQTHRAAQEALDTAMTVLRAGGGFGIYPEGTRSRDGRLARGKTGVAWLALTADCPVVPVAVAGARVRQPPPVRGGGAVSASQATAVLPRAAVRRGIASLPGRSEPAPSPRRRGRGVERLLRSRPCQ